MKLTSTLIFEIMLTSGTGLTLSIWIGVTFINGDVNVNVKVRNMCTLTSTLMFKLNLRHGKGLTFTPTVMQMLTVILFTVLAST